VCGVQYIWYTIALMNSLLDDDVVMSGVVCDC
jgi:hypothetical protein